MANLRAIRTRIKSVENTRQITKSMKMVAAAKLRKTQSAFASLRTYADESGKLLADASAGQTGIDNPYLTPHAECRRICYVLIVGNRGLCGTYNQSLLRYCEKLIKDSDREYYLIVCGRWGREQIASLGRPVLRVFDTLSDNPTAPLRKSQLYWFRDSADVEPFYVGHSFTTDTLRQGIGALVWADEKEQAKRPCFVLAPQYSEKSAHDDYTVGWAAEATIQLIQYICSKYNIDKTRIYGTGQSMGTMMLCELLITHPRFFAGCFLTAGQWDPERMAAIKDEHVWIMVSEHDGRAFPIMGACMEAVEKAGGKVARGHVDAKADEETKEQFCKDVLAQNANIQFTWLDGDSVLLPGAHIFPAVHHMSTWKWAYLFEPIRAWLFEQKL